MSDDKFVKKYRMSREHLDMVAKEIKGHEVFERKRRGPKQHPVKHQIMVLLHFLGHEGQSDLSQRHTFFIGEGTCRLFRQRVVEALVSIRLKYISWPGEDERKEVASRIKDKYFLPNCVGLMDGTLSELRFRPSTDDTTDYSGRKYAFSLTIMVICDDRRKIRAYLSGFPGCTHDNCLWNYMLQYQ